MFKNTVLNDLRLYIELKFGLLPEKKLAFVEKASKMKKNGFKGSRVQALRFCLKAFSIIYTTNTAVITKTRPKTIVINHHIFWPVFISS